MCSPYVFRLSMSFGCYRVDLPSALAHDGTASEGWDREGQQDAMEYMTWLVDAITESVPEEYV